MSLERIAIQLVDADAPSVGNIRALLTEIATLLQALLAQQRPGVIDLNGLPFAPGEYAALRTALGQGELSARLTAIGNSEILETRYPGVWWVTHYNVDGDLVADLIEVTFCPELLRSPPEDVRDGLAQLRDLLEQPND